MERARVACWGERHQGLSPRPLTGICCDGSPERLVDPCLELNLFHDSANLPRLALRLRLRLSALSSRSEQPRSISAASLHFFPMLSSPPSAGQHPGAGLRALSLVSLTAGSHSRLREALCWRRLCLRRLQPQPCARLPSPPPPSCACARDWLNCGLGLRAPPAPKPVSFCASKLLSTPQPPPSLGDARPTPGLLMCRSAAIFNHPTLPSPPGLEVNLIPHRAAGASLGNPQ